MISTLRSKWETQVEKVEELPDRVSEGIQSDTSWSQLNSILAKMPPKRSEVFRMSKLEGLPVEEIAARMGISVRTVPSVGAQRKGIIESQRLNLGL